MSAEIFILYFNKTIRQGTRQIIEESLTLNKMQKVELSGKKIGQSISNQLLGGPNLQTWDVRGSNSLRKVFT